MKLYKFRSLGDDKSLSRVIDIIDNGVYCNCFLDFNDMNEGIYEHNIRNNNISLSEKENYKICSFSGETAINNELMWGHYANAGKGVLIEFSVDEEIKKKIKEVKYTKDKKKLSTIVDILTHKLEDWKYENEYRYLCTDDLDSNKIKIGTITKIHFGTPYEKLKNYDKIKEKHKKLNEYHKLKEKLINVCEKKNIEHEDFIFNF